MPSELSPQQTLAVVRQNLSPGQPCENRLINTPSLWAALSHMQGMGVGCNQLQDSFNTKVLGL